MAATAGAGAPSLAEHEGAHVAAVSAPTSRRAPADVWEEIAWRLTPGEMRAQRLASTFSNCACVSAALLSALCVSLAVVEWTDRAAFLSAALVVVAVLLGAPVVRRCVRLQGARRHRAQGAGGRGDAGTQGWGGPEAGSTTTVTTSQAQAKKVGGDASVVNPIAMNV